MELPKIRVAKEKEAKENKENKENKESIEIHYWKEEEHMYKIQIEWVTPKGKKRGVIRTGNLNMLKEYGKLYGVKPIKIQ